MMELVHISAQYSNAVLVAVLPYVTDFATKLELPIHQPVEATQVIHCQPSRYKDYLRTSLVLSNHCWFALDPRGFVDGFRAPTNWFSEQEFTDGNIKRYLGQDRMTTNEAVAMARSALVKLGYKPELTHSYEIPKLEGPYDLHRKEVVGHVPYCRVTWEWPITDNMVDLNHIKMEINMETRTLVGMDLVFSKTNHLQTSPVKVNVVPELESDYRKRVGAASSKMFVNTNAPPRFPGNSPSKNWNE